MDLIMKHDHAFKWDEKDEQQASASAHRRHRSSVFNKAKKMLSKAAHPLRRKKLKTNDSDCENDNNIP
jgi:hypothetical protein